MTETERSCLFEPGEPGWGEAWAGLAAATGDSDFAATHPASGESWHYMGTWKTSVSGHWVHQFRHRMHPTDDLRRLVNVPASYIREE